MKVFKVVLGFILLIVIGVVAVMAWFWYQSTLPETSTSTQESQVLDQRLSMVYALAFDGGSLGYSVVNITKDSNDILLPEYAGSIVEYKKHGSAEAVIVLNGDKQDVLFRMGPNEDFISIASDYFIKLGLTFNNGGTKLFFSQYDENSSGAINAPSSWKIMEFDSVSGDYAELTSGFNPQIMASSDDELLFFTGDQGFEIYSVNEGFAFDSPIRQTQSTRYPAWITPDGSKVLVYNRMVREYDVFSIALADPLQIQPLYTIPVNKIDAVTNTDIFFVDTTDGTLAAYTIEEQSRGSDLYAFSSDNQLLPFRVLTK